MAKLSNDELIAAFKEMTLIELSDFVKLFEETFDVEAAKTLRDFAKDNPALVLKSGAMDGAPLSAEGVKKLADLESREVLLAKAAGVLKAKIGQAAFAFNALPVKAVRTIDALREKQQGEAA